MIEILWWDLKRAVNKQMQQTSMNQSNWNKITPQRCENSCVYMDKVFFSLTETTVMRDYNLSVYMFTKRRDQES